MQRDYTKSICIFFGFEIDIKVSVYMMCNQKQGMVIIFNINYDRENKYLYYLHI